MKLNYGQKGRFSYYENKELIVGSGYDTRGGAYFFYKQAQIDIKNELFLGNRVSKDGGGIYFYKCKNILIENCMFICNYAKWGGAIYFEQCSDIVLKHNKFILNFAYRDGGAISLSCCSGIRILKDNFYLGNIAMRSCKNIEYHNCKV